MRLPDDLKPTVDLALADVGWEFLGIERPSMEGRIVLRAPCDGTVAWVDLLHGINLHEAMDEVTGLSCRVVVRSPRQDPALAPRLDIGGERIDLAPGTVIVGWGGEVVAAGDVVAWRLAEPSKT